MCLDRAVWLFASTVENEQEQATARLPASAKPKAHERARERVLRQYLGLPSSTAGQFKDPGK